MVGSFFYDEEGADSPASSRRSRVEWKLRKQFDYAGHRREMVQSFRDAEKYFKENLQFPKVRRRESTVEANRATTAECERAQDELDADVHRNMGALVTPAGGGFGPGYGAQTGKKTLDEKRAARERLVRRIHDIEGYAATPGVIATVDAESGRVKAVTQTKRDVEELRSKGHCAPFVDKARLFPPLRTKTIPSTALTNGGGNYYTTATNNNNKSKSNNNNDDDTADHHSISSKRSVSREIVDGSGLLPISLNNNRNKPSESFQYTKTLKNQHDDDDLTNHLQIPQAPAFLPNSSRQSAISSLSQKIMNQTTPTAFPPLTAKSNDQQFVSLTPRGVISSLSSLAVSRQQNLLIQQQQDPNSSKQKSLLVSPEAPNISKIPLSLPTTSDGLEQLFSTARTTLKNAPIATAHIHTTSSMAIHNNNNARYFLGTANNGVAGHHTVGSSRQTSRMQSRKQSFIAKDPHSNNNPSENANVNHAKTLSNGNTNWNELLGSGATTEYGSLTLPGSVYGGPGSPPKNFVNNNAHQNSVKEQSINTNCPHQSNNNQIPRRSSFVQSGEAVVSQVRVVNNLSGHNTSFYGNSVMTKEGTTPKNFGPSNSMSGGFSSYNNGVSNSNSNNTSQQQQGKQILKITISSNNVSV